MLLEMGKSLGEMVCPMMDDFAVDGDAASCRLRGSVDSVENNS